MRVNIFVMTMTQRVSFSEKVLLFFLALLLTTLFSTCSFFYPLNPWDDANVYMTIGNAMLGGKELYVDIFDHKGPVLFFLHEWAAMLSRNSFVGIYLVEIVCSFVYLIYSLRTLRMFSSSSVTFPFVCLLGVITYTSDFFSYGDSVEELSLPLLAQSLYFMLRFVKDRHAPHWWQSLIMGVGIGLIFWMKYNLLFFYIGGVLALWYIAKKNGQMQELFRAIGWIFVGFALVTAWVLLYFGLHGTLDALWESYFMVNIFHYHGTATNGAPDYWWFPFFKLSIWAILMLPALLLPVRKDVKLLLLGTYGLLMLSFAMLTVQFYYFLTVFTFFPLLICYARDYKPTWRTYLVFTLVTIWSVATNWNLVTRLNGTFPYCVLEMAEIVNANQSDDSKVLTFSSYDSGIYQHTDQLPPNPNFFISSYLNPDIKKEQAEWVASGKVKYLVRVIGAVKTCHDYYDAPIPENYHLIYDKEELFRYRFCVTPHKFLWNLTWPRPILKYIMDPVTVNQKMQVYERRP